MEINYWIIFIAGLIPMVVGFIWYHEKTFGKAWRKSVGLTEEQANSGNMAAIMGLSYLFACMISAMMIMWTTHQLATQSLFATQPEFKDSASEMSIFF